MLPGNTDVAQLASGPCRVQMPYLTFPFRELCESTHRHTVILHTAGQGLFSLKGRLVTSLARMQKLGFQVGSYSSLKAEHGTPCLHYLSKQCVPCGAPAVPAGGVPACTTHFTTLLEEPSAAVGLGWRFPRPTAGAHSSSLSRVPSLEQTTEPLFQPKTHPYAALLAALLPAIRPHTPLLQTSLTLNLGGALFL